MLSELIGYAHLFVVIFNTLYLSRYNSGSNFKLYYYMMILGNSLGVAYGFTIEQNPIILVNIIFVSMGVLGLYNLRKGNKNND